MTGTTLFTVVTSSVGVGTEFGAALYTRATPSAASEWASHTICQGVGGRSLLSSPVLAAATVSAWGVVTTAAVSTSSPGSTLPPCTVSLLTQATTSSSPAAAGA